MVRALILAAGKGKRLFPLTKDTPKCLLEVGGISIIERQIDTLNRCEISDIIVVTGFEGDKIKQTLGEKAHYIFNPFYEKTNSVVSLWFAREFLKGDVLLFNSDVLFDIQILKELLGIKDNICVVVSNNWVIDKGYKVAVEGDRITNMGMDIREEDIFGEYAGMIKVPDDKTEKLIGMLDRFMFEKRFNEWFETAILELIKEGETVNFLEIGDRWWMEIDYYAELEEARNYFERRGGVI